MTDCPCGSEATFADCCGRYLDGGAAPDTAEALMRSRYAAYARARYDYLEATSVQGDVVVGPSPEWLGLEVRGTRQGGVGDSSGTVEFVATFRADGVVGRMHEVSRFVRDAQHRWVYLDGEQRTPPRIGRNDPCPCRSGRKFKRCCGR